MSPTLADVSELIIDTEHNTPKFTEDGFPCIRTPNIGRGFFILENVKRVSEETYRAWIDRAEPRENDLVLAREAPVGNVAVIPRNLPLCIGQRTVLVRPIPEKVNPRYLCYLLLGDEMQAAMHSYSGGATVAHLNMSDIRKLSLPELPKMEVQKEIASILSAYDGLIENNTRRIRILEEMVQALYREWFVHFRFPGREKVKLINSPVGKIPKGWEVVRLGDLARETRRSVSPDLIDPRTPYIGLEHLPRKSIALSEWGSANQVKSTKLAFTKGEILFGKIRPYFHKVGVALVDGVCSSDIIVISTKKPEYFSIVLAGVSSEEFVRHATQTSQGTKMPRANWKVLLDYHLLVPPDSIKSKFNNILENIVAQIEKMIFMNKNLHHTRDLLLPKLISGEIDISGAKT